MANKRLLKSIGMIKRLLKPRYTEAHFCLTISAKYFAQRNHRQCNFICCACWLCC